MYRFLFILLAIFFFVLGFLFHIYDFILLCFCIFYLFCFSFYFVFFAVIWLYHLVLYNRQIFSFELHFSPLQLLKLICFPYIQITHLNFPLNYLVILLLCSSNYYLLRELTYIINLILLNNKFRKLRCCWVLFELLRIFIIQVSVC